jgi:hypothetical protein
MEFASEVQRKCFERVVAIAEAIGEKNNLVGRVSDEAPRYILQRGSNYVFIDVNAFSERAAMVHVRSFVTIRPRMEVELLERLLRENASWGGCPSFGIKDGSIVLDCSFLSSGAENDQLFYAVEVVSQNADTWDDLLVEKFGGRRASDPPTS